MPRGTYKGKHLTLFWAHAPPFDPKFTNFHEYEFNRFAPNFSRIERYLYFISHALLDTFVRIGRIIGFPVNPAIIEETNIITNNINIHNRYTIYPQTNEFSVFVADRLPGLGAKHQGDLQESIREDIHPLQAKVRWHEDRGPTRGGGSPVRY